MATNDWIQNIEKRIRDLGGTFLRFTANGKRLWKLGVSIITLPGVHSGSDSEASHLRKNYEAQAERAIQKYIKSHPQQPVPKDKISPLAEVEEILPVVEAPEQPAEQRQVTTEEILAMAEPTPQQLKEETSVGRPRVNAYVWQRGCTSCGKNDFKNRSAYYSHLRWGHKAVPSELPIKRTEPEVLVIGEGVESFFSELKRLKEIKEEYENLKKENALLKEFRNRALLLLGSETVVTKKRTQKALPGGIRCNYCHRPTHVTKDCPGYKRYNEKKYKKRRGSTR